jgi:hypothetical protein
MRVLLGFLVSNIPSVLFFVSLLTTKKFPLNVCVCVCVYKNDDFNAKLTNVMKQLYYFMDRIY